MEETYNVQEVREVISDGTVHLLFRGRLNEIGGVLLGREEWICTVPRHPWMLL